MHCRIAAISADALPQPHCRIAAISADALPQPHCRIAAISADALLQRSKRYSHKGVAAGISRPKFSGQTEYPLSYGSKRDIILVMPYGSAQIEAYNARIRETESGTEVLCKHCCEWKPASGFHLGNGKFKSMCKACHSSRYNKAAGYESPTAKAKKESAHARKIIWLAELQECTICGEVKERRHFYNAQRKGYLPYCCSPRRTHEQIEIDIAEQMKTCFECGLRLPFDEFSYAPNGRDKKKPYCKCCIAAIMHEKSDRPERQRMMDETGNGSVTVPRLSMMLRESTNCSHCGVAMTQSYPVRPTQRTIDHNLPLSRGGKHVIENMSIMCLSCNSAKQDRTIEEFSRVKKKMVP